MTAQRASVSRGGVIAALAMRLDNGLVAVSALLAVLGMCALVVAIAVVIGDIVWRRIGGGSFIGSVDLTQFSVMIAVSLAIPYAFATSGHVSVDLLSRAVSPMATHILNVTASLAGAVITGFLCWLSMGRAVEIWTYGDVSQDLALPMIWAWSSLVFGLGFSALICTVRALCMATNRRA